MLGTTSHDLPLPMPWRRCANTIGDKWVFASPIAKSRDKNYPASCANASPMHSAGRLDGQSRAQIKSVFEQSPLLALLGCIAIPFPIGRQRLLGRIDTRF